MGLKDRLIGILGVPDEEAEDDMEIITGKEVDEPYPPADQVMIRRNKVVLPAPDAPDRK